jgi:hypothetical protein
LPGSVRPPAGPCILFGPPGKRDQHFEDGARIVHPPLRIVRNIPHDEELPTKLFSVFSPIIVSRQKVDKLGIM